MPRRRPRARYTGPPSYAATPRWSLAPTVPAGATPVTAPDGSSTTADDPHARLRRLAGLLGNVTRITAALSVVAAVAEGWRYVLLLVSRDAALSAAPLTVDDVLVGVAGGLAAVAALITGLLFLQWLLDARAIVADETSTVPSRRPWAVVIGAVIPVSTVVVPGAALAELEHVASGGPSGDRPRPSRPVARWWVAWAVSVVLGLAAFLRGLSGSTQAMADGVVLHGLADLAAAVTAVLTAWMVEHLTELVAPELRPAGRDTLVRVPA